MKTNILCQTQRRSYGFSLVEMLVVIAIISILATLVISSFSNAAQDSREIMARQQQAVVQSAVSNWVASEVGTFFDPDPSDTTPGDFQSIGDVLSRYNSAATGLARLALVRAYLDDPTYTHITTNTTDPAGNQLKSGAMTKVTPQRYLQMPAWVGGSYPKVELLP
jgi:prepilin-type N-terminal cleavage/methylation domain-containing protein